VFVRERDERENVEELFQRSERERKSVRVETLQQVEGIAAKNAMTNKRRSIVNINIIITCAL
tara:strand:- start:105 stop:290 length:186 start_codon:yes stop_codon:yes gene_type:complete